VSPDQQVLLQYLREKASATGMSEKKFVCALEMNE
jgi:hypothetical protein